MAPRLQAGRRTPVAAVAPGGDDGNLRSRDPTGSELKKHCRVVPMVVKLPQGGLKAVTVCQRSGASAAAAMTLKGRWLIAPATHEKVVLCG